MKKSALRVTNRWLSYLLVSLQAVTSMVFILAAFEPVHAADFLSIWQCDLPCSRD